MALKRNTVHAMMYSIHMRISIRVIEIVTQYISYQLSSYDEIRMKEKIRLENMMASNYYNDICSSFLSTTV